MFLKFEDKVHWSQAFDKHTLNTLYRVTLSTTKVITTTTTTTTTTTATRVILSVGMRRVLLSLTILLPWAWAEFYLIETEGD